MRTSVSGALYIGDEKLNIRETKNGARVRLCCENVCDDGSNSSGELGEWTVSHSTSERVRCVSATQIGDDCVHEKMRRWDNNVCHRRRSCDDDGRHRERSMSLPECYELVGNTEHLSCPGRELDTKGNGAWPLSTSSQVSESKSDVGRGSCGRTCWWMWGKEDKIGGRRVREGFICRSGSWRNRGEPPISRHQSPGTHAVPHIAFFLFSSFLVRHFPPPLSPHIIPPIF